MAKTATKLSGPVHCEVLDRDGAQGLEDLANFCCGHCGLDQSAAEVNNTVAQLYTGGEPQQGGAPVFWAVLLRDAQDALLGLVGLTLQHPDVGGGTFLQAYGREKRLKHHVLADRKTTLGAALVRAAIDLSTQKAPGPDALDIFAFTHLNNYTSHKVLKRSGFKALPGEPVVGPPGAMRYTLPSGNRPVHQQQLWHRPAGEPLKALPDTVYTGPVLTK